MPELIPAKNGYGRQRRTIKSHYYLYISDTYDYIARARQPDIPFSKCKIGATILEILAVKNALIKRLGYCFVKEILSGKKG